ncbi:MAG: FAD-dependent oxidoreductase [Comamonadaceae bacterium]|nr:MAG: FAD-dependent oxidoreductase [Comamonadaceae bacterium]
MTEPNDSSAENFDVIVIGGGPGGSTAASFVAMQGHSVLLLDRDTFPRHQIGESLLPATVHGICAMLGMTEELANAGFPRKRGGTFRWGKSQKPWTFTFAKDTNAPGGYAYQVERERFDKMLLDNSRRKGVDVREAHMVEDILFENGRASGVRFTDPDGNRKVAKARFVIDAGGNRAQKYNMYIGERIYSKFFQNVALYGYFEGGKRLPAPNQGNIITCAFKDGWFWYVPLSDTLTGVGAVVSRDAAKLMREGHEEAYASYIEACPLIKEQLEGAKRIEEGSYAGLRLRKDYSYCHTKFWAPGLVMVGDSACFIDPVFSSGVHLATYSALLAARSINTVLKGMAPEEKCFEEFERRYRREYGNFYQFLIAFYDMHEDTESYFWSARKVLGTEEQANEAFVRLVAGVSAEDEPVFNSSEYFKVRVGLGDWFQEHMSKTAEDAVMPDRTAEFDKAKFDPGKFMQGFTSEIQQLQMQAMFKEERPQDKPMVSEGLIPSRDGFHWEAGVVKSEPRAAVRL